MTLVRSILLTIVQLVYTHCKWIATVKEIWIRAVLSPAHSNGKVQEDIKEADIWESLKHEGLLLNSKH